MEKLSSWDLETVQMKKSMSFTKEDSISVTLEELKSPIYTPEDYEWPSCQRDTE